VADSPGGSDGAQGMLRRAFEMARAQLATERALPRADCAAEELEERLDIGLSSEGASFDEVTSRLAAILAATPSAASPLFLNQLFGGRDEIASLAEMLTPLVNTSMYTYKVAGPQVLVEREVLARMARKVGYADGEGTLCPGGSLATLTAMMIARNEAYPEVRDHGFGPAGGLGATLYTSADSHYSIRKNAGILGLGRASVRQIPTDPAGRMRVDALRLAIGSDRAAGLHPLLVNATAGTTVFGAFDPLREISRVARDEGLWLHVDGALGGSVLLCREHRSLLDGAELSDSFAWNAHKMMGVPLPCSALLLARRGLLTRHLAEAADYLFQSSSDELNPGTRSLQCGRRNDALKLWAAWKLHGDQGYDRKLSRLFELARYAAAEIDASPDFELLLPPESINVCFEVPGKSSVEICDRLSHEGRLLIGHGAACGRRAIRLVCVNADLGEADIDTALQEVRRAAAATPAVAVPAATSAP
jgi:glutamate/tyrosine decarboxylase-like PLP-dependent enzyme